MGRRKVPGLPFSNDKGRRGMGHRIYIVISTLPGKPQKALLLFTSGNILRRMLKHGYIAEYRACRGILQAAGMVLVYNFKWAACFYRKPHGLRKCRMGKRRKYGNKDG